MPGAGWTLRKPQLAISTTVVSSAVGIQRRANSVQIGITGRSFLQKVGQEFGSWMMLGRRRCIALCFQDRRASHADGAVHRQPQKWRCFSASKSFCSTKQGLFRAFLSPLHLAHIFSEDHQDAEFRASSRCQNLCSQPCSSPSAQETSARAAAQWHILSISQTGPGRPAGLTSSGPQHGGLGKRTGRPGLSPGHRGLWWRDPIV